MILLPILCFQMSIGDHEDDDIFDQSEEAEKQHLERCVQNNHINNNPI